MVRREILLKQIYFASGAGFGRILTVGFGRFERVFYFHRLPKQKTICEKIKIKKFKRKVQMSDFAKIITTDCQIC